MIKGLTGLDVGKGVRSWLVDAQEIDGVQVRDLHDVSEKTKLNLEAYRGTRKLASTPERGERNE